MNIGGAAVHLDWGTSLIFIGLIFSWLYTAREVSAIKHELEGITGLLERIAAREDSK